MAIGLVGGGAEVGQLEAKLDELRQGLYVLLR